MDLTRSNIEYLICVSSGFNFKYCKIPRKIIYLDCSNSFGHNDNLNLAKYKNLKFLISQMNGLCNPLKLPSSLIYLDLSNNPHTIQFQIFHQIFNILY